MDGYFRCLFTSFVISNMLTADFPPKTGFSVASALIIRLFVESWSLFFLMYAQRRLVISVRGLGLEPTTSASTGLGDTGRMNAALAVLFLFAGAFVFLVPPVLLALFVVLAPLVLFALFALFVLLALLALFVRLALAISVLSTCAARTRVPEQRLAP
jgi:hypothetical protein